MYVCVCVCIYIYISVINRIVSCKLSKISAELLLQWLSMDNLLLGKLSKGVHYIVSLETKYIVTLELPLVLRSF